FIAASQQLLSGGLDEFQLPVRKMQTVSSEDLRCASVRSAAAYRTQADWENDGPERHPGNFGQENFGPRPPLAVGSVRTYWPLAENRSTKWFCWKSNGCCACFFLGAASARAARAAGPTFAKASGG